MLLIYMAMMLRPVIFGMLWTKITTGWHLTISAVLVGR